MQLSSRARLVAGLLAALAFAAYLVIVDLGLYAGKVHRGVTVAGYDVGGLSFPELVDALEDRRDDLLTREIVFSTDGFRDVVTGAELGWDPHVFDTARATYATGRTGGIIDSAEGRLRAWFGEVSVSWENGIRHERLGRLIARWEREAGIDVDDGPARRLIRTAIGAGARDVYEIPLDGQK
ncbi:MAG: hypothetical protein GEU78_00860 [Actinobacteria bacterium]|nr:hypothetical protein [Actinomycetota bacterium]